MNTSCLCMCFSLLQPHQKIREQERVTLLMKRAGDLTPVMLAVMKNPEEVSSTAR